MGFCQTKSMKQEGVRAQRIFICKEGLTMKDTVSKLSKQRSVDMRRGRTMGKR